MTVAEGRYHQVRRMFAALGNRVVALHRDRVGALDLPADLAPGAWRLLAPAEVAAALGGDAGVDAPVPASPPGEGGPASHPSDD